MIYEKITAFLKKHNSSIGLVLITTFGGILIYKLISYYYIVNPVTAPYTGFMP